MTIEKTTDDDLLIIDDEPTLEPEGERKTAPVKRQDEISPDAVESLKAQLASLQAERDAERRERDVERQRREAAEADARKLSEAATKASRTAEYTHYQLVESHISAAKARADDLKRQIRAAHETGDYDRATDLQMEAAKVATRLLQYEDTKADIEQDARRKQREAEQIKAEPVKPQQPQSTGDAFEDRIANLSETSKAWLRQHKECVTDDVRNAEVVAADARAKREGLKPDTPEYFAFIEEKLGYRQAQPQQQAADDDGEEIEEGVIVSDPKPVRPAAVTAAPVSRGSQGVNGKATSIRLTRAEAEMAEALGMSPKEYYINKQKADQEGRYRNN